MDHRRDRPPGPASHVAYGCLVGAIILAVVAGLLAITFLWDVNLPH